jgi:hypothetical protein
VKVIRIFEELEARISEDDYRSDRESLMRALFGGAYDRFYRTADVSDAEQLRHTRGGQALEIAARCVGFVLGFEMAKKGA